MKTKIDFSEFQSVFLANAKLRSRTVGGHVHTNVSDRKLPLLFAGQELQSRVDANLLKASEVIYKDAEVDRLTPEWCQTTFNKWFDLLQDGLLDMPGYAKKCEALGIHLENVRYRIWDVSYNPMSPVPADIGKRMDAFCRILVKLNPSPTKPSHMSYISSLLAFVDCQLDSVIHPWLDGCGRFATVVVMWVAVRSGVSPLPKFGDRVEHYQAIKSLGSHTDYFRRCLNR